MRDQPGKQQLKGVGGRARLLVGLKPTPGSEATRSLGPVTKASIPPQEGTAEMQGEVLPANTVRCSRCTATQACVPGASFTILPGFPGPKSWGRTEVALNTNWDQSASP